MKVRISKIRTWFWWLLSFWFVIAFIMPVFTGLVPEGSSEKAINLVRIVLFAYSIVLILYMCLTWHCPGCKRLTLMTASYCLRCGTELNPDDTTDVV